MESSLPPFHGSFQMMKPNPLLLWLTLSLPFFPIKACLHGLNKLVLVLTLVAILVLKGRYQKIGVARGLLCIHKALPKWGDLVTKERESLSLIPSSFCKTCVAEHPAKGGLDVRTLVVFSFVELLIIDDYHYGSILIVLVMVDVELYPSWLMYNCIY